MAKYESKIIEKKEVWEKFLLGKNPKTFLQSWNWGEVNKKDGVKIFRLGFYKDTILCGVCLAIVEKARRGPHFIVPAGPILDWTDRKMVRYFIDSVKNLARSEGCWFIRVRPEILDTEANRKLFAGLGFISAPMHLHAENTWVLDITGSEDQILSSMRKTTRYLVRKGEKTGLLLIISDDPNSATVLHKLQEETIKRHGFIGFSEGLFRNEIQEFAKDNQARVFICKKGKEVLAMAIIIFYGDTAYYHFSGSVSKYNEIPFSYYLQWQIIKEAKKRGLKYYNFWGIAPNNSPKHRFAGVTLFKTGFGGERIDWLHAHDLPVSKLYWASYIFETIRRKVRHL